MNGLKALQFGLFLTLLGFTVNLFSMALFAVSYGMELAQGETVLSGQFAQWGGLCTVVSLLLSAIGKMCCIGTPEKGARNHIIGSLACDIGIFAVGIGTILSVGGSLMGGGAGKALASALVGIILIAILVIASYIFFLKFLARLGANIGEPRVEGLVDLLFKLIIASMCLGFTRFISAELWGLLTNIIAFVTTITFNYTIYLLFRALPLYMSEVEAGITDAAESGEERTEREKKARRNGPGEGGGGPTVRPPEEPQGTPPQGSMLYRIPKGLDSLNLAVKEGDRFKVETQLARGADPMQTVKHGLTPLHIAASVGVMDVADALIKGGAQVDATCESGLTPLYFAIQTGNPNIVGYFLNKGANLFHRNEEGLTPLHWACCVPHPNFVGPDRTKMVNMLISQGGDVNALTTSGKSCRDIALENKLEDLVSALDRHQGAPSASKSSFQQTPGGSGSQSAPTEPSAFTPFLGTHLSTMPSNLSPLLACVKEGEPEKIKREIVQGASINESAEGGIAPVHITAITGVMSCTDLLLSLGANVDDECDYKLTSLFLAVHANNMNMAGYLINRGADVNHQDELGRTALHWAAAAPTEKLQGQNRAKMVEFLLDHGAKLEVKDNEGKSALDLARLAGEEDATTALSSRVVEESPSAASGSSDDDDYYV